MRNMNDALPNWTIFHVRSTEQCLLVRGPSASKVSSLFVHPSFYHRASETIYIIDIAAFAVILLGVDG